MKLKTWFVAASLLAMVGCKDSASSKSGDAPKTENAPAAAEKGQDLSDPSTATMTAPEEYTVKLATAEGDILIDVKRAWAPLGADRFYNLVKMGFYDDTAFFRVIPGFMAQIGIHGDPKISAAWRSARIQDDPVKESNKRGMVSFATSGPNTRTTQFFINFGDNSRLDGMGFAPFGKVRNMEIVDKLHGGYGEGAPQGKGPNQGRLNQLGNEYLKKDFPELDYIQKATIEG
jgi:peptidyl-prolyl cis-trans isomerase A (cyclophilin A)